MTEDMTLTECKRKLKSSGYKVVKEGHYYTAEKLGATYKAPFLNTLVELVFPQQKRR